MGMTSALQKKVVVKADAVTASARTKIEQAGGKVELIAERGRRPKFVRKDGTKAPPRTQKKS